MKKVLGILLILVLLPTVALSFFHGIRLILIPEEVEITVGQAIILQEMQFFPTITANAEVFPGDVLGSGVVAIKNVSPVSQWIWISAKPTRVSSENHPFLRVELPFAQPIVLSPGEKIDIDFAIYIDFQSPPSTFEGVELHIEVVPPLPSPLG